MVILTWHLLWMHRHAAELRRALKNAGHAVRNGDKEPIILGLIVGLAILREGSEAVIFLYGMATAGSDASDLILGAALGIVSGIASGTVLYLGIARIPTGRLFQVSNWLLLLLTAGIASQAASFLVQADLLPALGYNLWDASFLPSEQGLTDRVLHILIGYVDHPLGIQVLTYTLTIGRISATDVCYESGRPKNVCCSLKRAKHLSAVH